MHLFKVLALFLIAFSAVAEAAKRSYYDVLGVPHDAEQADVRRAYRHDLHVKCNSSHECAVM
jgi:preprotein translocase subunit Sec63